MSNEIRFHELFSAGDPNEVVVIQSCNNIRFNIHRKNLETSTGAFPGAEFQTNGEVVHLTETGDILAILFQFIYPRRHPSLEGLDFALLVQVAEAAEKYEVFAAMNIASIRLSEALPTQNGLEVLAHGIKHNYPALIDEAALSVARYPWATITKKLPFVAMHAWARYQEAWTAVFEAGMKALTGLPQHTHCQNRAGLNEGFLGVLGSSQNNRQSNPAVICGNCFIVLKAWVMSLEKVTGGAADLSKAITNPGDLGMTHVRNAATILPQRGTNQYRPTRGYEMCVTCPGDITLDSTCINLAKVQDALLGAMKKVPRFSTLC